MTPNPILTDRIRKNRPAPTTHAEQDARDAAALQAAKAEFMRAYGSRCTPGWTPTRESIAREIADSITPPAENGKKLREGVE